MAERKHYEVLIIGGGQAGIPLAHALAEKGKRVALVEERHLGGSCVNFGCAPTRAVIASARVAHLARRAKEFGLKIPKVSVDFPAVLKRAERILLESRDGLRKRLEKTKNPKLLKGHARFAGRDGEHFRVRVGESEVITAQAVIDTGTRSLIPPTEGLESVDFICAENWLEQRKLPARLAIIGGGYIGLEMSQFYRRMGSHVVVIEEAAQVAGHEDEDVARAVQQLLEAEEIEFRLRAKVTSIKKRKDGVALTLKERGAGSTEIRASHLFVATGRKPNTDDLGLETIGVKVSERGIIEADKRLATNIEGVWVAGDVRGGPMFTHTSWDDYRVLLSQIAGDGSRTTERVVPYAIFTDPQLGRVGLTESEAREKGRRIKVARFEMKKNGRARESGETEGFIKVLVDEKTKRLLGAAVLAAEGLVLVHFYLDLVNADAPYTIIRNAVHIHPTLAEAAQSGVAQLN